MDFGIGYFPTADAFGPGELAAFPGGRFDLGVGAGWNREDMEHHGTDPRTRMRLLAERVEAIKALWSDAPTCLPRRGVIAEA
ncbi:MAG: LLM class flavin-dependent oxidoreductase [Actinobacteria bacterium]|nr:LLM class flavin-dependent oxidoreductase [Actinomycetota bacterium]